MEYWSEGHDFINGKYNLNKEYLYPKNGITIEEYERIRMEKLNYERYLPEYKKDLFKKKRDKLKEDINKYLQKE